MKKIFILFVVLLGFATNVSAGERDRISINAGYMLPNTLNATVGYEMELKNCGAVEIFGELGDQWKHPVCHMFWKGYFWGGGAQYKYQLKKFKNGNFRIFGGGQVGAVEKNIYIGIRAGFEYNYVFANNWELSVQELNTVNFLHGRTFHNGILLGCKIPF